MTPKEALVATIAGSKSVLTDGSERRTASRIWQDAQPQRAQIGRNLVLACVDNTLDGVGIYLNLVFGDAVPVFFPEGTKPDVLSRFIDDFQPNFLITRRDSAAEFDGFELQFEWGAFGVFRAKTAYEHDFHEELCLLATTSGSTGSPKVVRQTFANLWENSRQIVAALGLGADSTAITALPISYTFGMSVVNCQIFAGGNLVVSALAPTQKGFLELLQSERVTLLSGVPQTYTQLNAMRFFKSRYAEGVQTYLQAGGKLAPALESDLVAKIADLGKDVFVMYGQAEATTRMSILPARDFGRVRQCAGPALAGGRFSVVDSRGAALGANQEGEIWYEGPNVSLGYASSCAELNAPDGFNGLLKTGDVGYVDAQGYLYITGRLKRFAKIKGVSVNLNHLEEILQSAVGAEVCCVEKDEKICVLHSPEIEEASIAAALQRGTNLMTRDVSFHAVVEFPQTASGKIQYSQIATLLSEPSKSGQPAAE